MLHRVYMGTFLNIPEGLADEESESLKQHVRGGQRAEEWLVMLANNARIPPQTRRTHRLNCWVRRDGTDEALSAALDFVDGGGPPWLTFYGARGTGKTHLALAIAWEFMLRGTAVVYRQAEDLLDDIRGAYRGGRGGDEEDYQPTLDHFRRVPLLVVDDLGAHAHGPTDWAPAKLDQILDYRYLHEALTVVTTNSLNTDDVPERILDRLLDTQKARMVRLRGESWRRVGSQASQTDTPGSAPRKLMAHLVRLDDGRIEPEAGRSARGDAAVPLGRAGPEVRQAQKRRPGHSEGS